MHSGSSPKVSLIKAQAVFLGSNKKNLPLMSEINLEIACPRCEILFFSLTENSQKARLAPRGQKMLSYEKVFFTNSERGLTSPLTSPVKYLA